MPKFLTTAGATYHIEDIIQNATKSVTLITPYLKLSQTLAERLKDADKAGLKITLIFGKEELKSDQKAILLQLKNLEIFYLENLHAKCYYNEEYLVLSSMNLYETSQNKNREMGVLFNAQEDKEMYEAAIKEAISIKNSASTRKDIGKSIEKLKQEHKAEHKLEIGDENMLDYLKDNFPNVDIEQAIIESSATTVLHDYPFKGVDVHIGGIITFVFYSDETRKEFGFFEKELKWQTGVKLEMQRVFWIPKWNRSVIMIYDIPESIAEKARIIKMIGDNLQQYHS